MDASDYASALHMARYDTGGCLSTIGEIADEVVVALRTSEARLAELQSRHLSSAMACEDCTRLAWALDAHGLCAACVAVRGEVNDGK